MWKKLYSNSGLILLAALAIGIWTSNLHSFYSQPQNQQRDPEAFLQQQQASAVEIFERQQAKELGQRVKAKYPGIYDDLADDEVGRRLKAKYPGATAICNDDTYSYSQTRSSTCPITEASRYGSSPAESKKQRPSTRPDSRLTAARKHTAVRIFPPV
jgi:hypothetical protein